MKLPAPRQRQDQLATTGQRVVGAVADLFVFGAIVTTPFVLLRGAIRLEGAAVAAFVAVVFVLHGVYVVAPTARWGRTFGKLIVGARVVMQDDGTLPGWRASVLRWFLPAFAWLIPYVGWAVSIGLRATLVRDPLRRGIHDRMAGTIVVRAEPGDPLGLPFGTG
ncbi:MAG: hypothetical protein QOJ69_2255 [Actinomycetota bacterium]|nr:hypothetical protein [Actinomycetota bacterium]